MLSFYALLATRASWAGLLPNDAPDACAIRSAAFRSWTFVSRGSRGSRSNPSRIRQSRILWSSCNHECSFAARRKSSHRYAYPHLELPFSNALRVGRIGVSRQ